MHRHFDRNLTLVVLAAVIVAGLVDVPPPWGRFVYLSAMFLVAMGLSIALFRRPASSRLRVPQHDSLLMVWVGASATVTLAVLHVVRRGERSDVILFLVALGLGLTWQQYQAWRRTRRERLVRP